MVFGAASRLVLDSNASLGGVAVTYKRGSDTVSVTATRGATRVETVVDDNASMMSRVEDFLIKASDLVLDEETIEPEPGDLILVDSDTYEVNPIGAEPCARRSDREGYYWRIHTKRIKTES